jgi:hypothetical protein
MLLVEVPQEAVEAARCLAHENAVTRLRGIRLARDHLDELERRAVAELRAAGTTWKRIGNVYGITPQSAHERFG